jgi:hypothetical protein
MLVRLPPSEIKSQATADLDALAKEVREHLQAAANDFRAGAERVTAAGDALICAKDQVKHGGWLKWLKTCDLSEDKAERYMRLARNRAQLDSADLRNLSVDALLKRIKESESTAPSNTPARTTSEPTSELTHLDVLGWWSSADHQARQHFLDGIGLRGIIDHVPPAWCDALKRELKSPAPVIEGEIVPAPQEQEESLDPSDPGPIPDSLDHNKGKTPEQTLAAPDAEHNRLIAEAKVRKFPPGWTAKKQAAKEKRDAKKAETATSKKKEAERKALIANDPKRMPPQGRDALKVIADTEVRP